MYSFNRLQSRDYSPPSVVRPTGYYRSYRPVGSFWGSMGSLFPYVGPGASLFGLIRSLGVLLAILYVAAPQYVAGLNPDLVYCISCSAMFLIIFPLLRHMFVIVWSASGILMWLLVVGVLFYSLNNPIPGRAPLTFSWPVSFPSLFSSSGISSGSRTVPPPPAFQYDRDGNQLRYVRFDNEEIAPMKKKEVQHPSASSPSSSYVPRWLFASEKNQGASRVAAPWSSVFNWSGGSLRASDELGYDYEALVKKYNPPSTHSGPPSWAVARPGDDKYFRNSHTGGIGESREDGGIGSQVLGAGQDMAQVVEKLAHQTLGK